MYSDGSSDKEFSGDCCVIFNIVQNSSLHDKYQIVSSGSTITGINFTSANTLTAGVYSLQIRFVVLSTISIANPTGQSSSVFTIELTVLAAQVSVPAD